MRPASHSRRFPAPLALALLFLGLLALHAPLLRLPYFWDEAGYYVPAARDLLLTGSIIPQSTPSNAHPPLVLAYLALFWKLFGQAPAVTRTAMLLVAAFTLSGLFRLARHVANAEVAAASVICTALYPVFFAQSSLAHLDLAAAGLTFWALHAYVEQRRWATAGWFSLAVLTKETAVLAPLALFAWEWIGLLPGLQRICSSQKRWSTQNFLLLLPVLPLSVWYAFHYSRTGFVFGNPEFFRYNVQDTLQPLRMVLALALRLWQVLGYMNLYVLTLIALAAMWLPPLHDQEVERPRIALGIQFSFLAVVVVYVLAMAAIGGAVLARYMLPVIPLVIILCVSTLWRRVRWWRAVVVVVAVAFGVGLFENPPYGLSIEDNLSYRDFIELHQGAEEFVAARYPTALVLTAWPANDELTRPYLGYVTRPMRVLRIENFSVEQLMAARDSGSDFDVALVFSTKYQPPHPWFEDWRRWQEWKTRFFGYHRDAPPAIAAEILGGKLVYTDRREGQWVGVIEMERVEEARAGARAK